MTFLFVLEPLDTSHPGPGQRLEQTQKILRSDAAAPGPATERCRLIQPSSVSPDFCLTGLASPPESSGTGSI